LSGEIRKERERILTRKLNGFASIDLDSSLMDGQTSEFAEP
jgi:hypothetical protein